MAVGKVTSLSQPDGNFRSMRFAELDHVGCNVCPAKLFPAGMDTRLRYLFVSRLLLSQIVTSCERY